MRQKADRRKEPEKTEGEHRVRETRWKKVHETAVTVMKDRIRGEKGKDRVNSGETQSHR